MGLTVETFLLEANRRAMNEGNNFHRYNNKITFLGKSAYCHIVGLGLGEWEITSKQGSILVELYNEAIKKFDFKHIGVLDFSWFRNEIVSCGSMSFYDL